MASPSHSATLNPPAPPQVLRGLAYLHAAGVAHGAVRASNVLATTGGHVKLADFSRAASFCSPAREADAATRRESTTTLCSSCAATGSCEGDADAENVWWDAPEVLAGGTATPGGDVWSVGSLCVELLCGAPPFTSTGRSAAQHRRWLLDLAAIAARRTPRAGGGMVVTIGELLGDAGSVMEPAALAFVRRCFAIIPADRPTVEELLSDPWIVSAHVQPETPR